MYHDGIKLYQLYYINN